ncbi:hypothetical protein B0H12DRAFT_1230548 [Mycena haematopus]|nr:hypothetical protein B0H12DRAFT_1230548 [Mycena haematopus]
MAVTLFSMHTIVIEHRERTRKSSKADIERLIEKSELKIISLESQITALIELRDRERTCVATLRDLISPIHTLPVELLAEIFELTIRDDNHIEDVFRASQVCSDWRQVAHSTPQLWTRPIQIDLRSRSVEEEQVYTDGLKAWLVRSAPLTIPVSLVLGHRRRDRRILDELLRTASRWRSFHSPGFASPSLINHLAECKLESLEELTLGSFTGNVDPTALPSFTTVPQLRTLKIHFSSNALPILMPWAQLTHLTLGADFPNLALDVLAQCPNLIKAVVSIMGWDVLPEARQDILALSHLRALSLSIFGLDSRHSISFLDSLATPALERRCLDFGSMNDGNDAWTQARFTAFQLRAPNITQLHLESASLTSDDLRTAIRHASSLTSLKIIFSAACINDALIDDLRYKAGVSPLAPHLRNLCLDHIGKNFTENILVGMIVSRWWSDIELASCVVPPAVSRWTRVELRGYVGRHVIDIVRNLSSDLPIIHD